MWGFKLFVIFFNFNVVFLPVFVDLGVQIWNGISISQTDFTQRTEIWDKGYEILNEGEEGGTRIKRQVQDEQNSKCSGEFDEGCDLIEGSGNTPEETTDPPPSPPTPSPETLLPKPHLLTLHISDNFSLKVNKECIISLALLQLPAVFLAIYGIVHACYQPTIGAKLSNSLSAFLLIFIPFSLIEFFTLLEVEFAHRGVRFLLEKLKQLFGFCCSDKTSLDLLYFLPSKDPTGLDRAHSVSICKIIFGCCLQLFFQTVLLSSSTKTEDFQISQLLSILCSAFIITKTAVSIVTYRRKTATQDEDESSTAGQKLKSFLSAQMSLLKQFLLALPLLVSSLIFQSGTLILARLIFGYFAFIYIMTVLFLHLALSIVFPYPAAEKMEKKLGLTFKYPQPNPENDLQKVTKHKIIRGFFNSWANVFIFLRPVEELSYYNVVHVGLLQPLRFLVNFITIIAMISFTWVSSTTYDSNLKIYLTVSLVIVLVAGILNELEMLCYFYFGKLFFLSKPPKEDPEKSVEMKEIQNNVGEKNGLHDTLKYIDADRISEDMPLLYQNEEEKKGEEKDVKKEEVTGNVSSANDNESPNQTISPDETTSLDQTMTPNKTVSPNQTLSAATFPESEKGEIEKKSDSSSSESDEGKPEDKSESMLSESDKNQTVNKSSLSISSKSSKSDHEETAETSVLEASKANNDETEKNSDTSDTDNEDTNKDTTESPVPSPIPPRIPLMTNVSIISARSVDGSCFIPEDAFDIVEPSQEMTKEDVKQTFNNIQEQGGKVGKEEFINTMMKLFPRYNMEENRKKLGKLFDRLDKNNDGLISFRQFMLVTIAFSNIPLEGKLIKIFQLIDENMDEELTYDEFADVVRDILVLKEERKISMSLVEERFSKNTFRDMGMDAEGKVTLRNFVEACTRHKFIFINYVENFKDGFLINQNVSIS